jgi:hypothetical protein
MIKNLTLFGSEKCNIQHFLEPKNVNCYIFRNQKVYTERDSKIGIWSAPKPRGSAITNDPILTQ